MSDVNPCLCNDIWLEILKELPVKTLGKCRCVCKSWHSLIVSPSFMAAHLKHYTRNDANSLIMYKETVASSNTEGFEQISLFRDLDMLKQGNTLHTSVCPFLVPRDLRVQTSLSSFYFVGPVNGLLCVSESKYLNPSDRILIWNPLIKKSVKLPNSTFTGNNSLLGFGYDYRMYDHRVVKISYLDANTPFVEVYSVQERIWRTISAKYLVDNSINNVSSSHCFHNGVIYWLILTKRNEFSYSLGEYLLLFDVAEEKFAKMELPEEFVNIGSGVFGIFEYHGMLSLSYCNYTVFREPDFSADFKIWVKREYNVEGSWCKILRVGVLHDYFHKGPIEYLGANEMLIGIYRESVRTHLLMMTCLCLTMF
ncbi:F-box/kelch-repeat protein At3g06240-like [Silene latifolia]|uniref:F-box/kelch-repeat protein At3g06240-like n=1 Tax=Silene latifolia TaxID=37657 RepID=UPI003D7799BC